jgi:hypothetical protein
MAAVIYYVALAFKKAEDDGGDIVALRSERSAQFRTSDPNGGRIVLGGRMR